MRGDVIDVDTWLGLPRLTASVRPWTHLKTSDGDKELVVELMPQAAALVVTNRGYTHLGRCCDSGAFSGAPYRDIDKAHIITYDSLTDAERIAAALIGA